MVSWHCTTWWRNIIDVNSFLWFPRHLAGSFLALNLYVCLYANLMQINKQIYHTLLICMYVYKVVNTIHARLLDRSFEERLYLRSVLLFQERISRAQWECILIAQRIQSTFTRGIPWCIASLQSELCCPTALISQTDRCNYSCIPINSGFFSKTSAWNSRTLAARVHRRVTGEKSIVFSENERAKRWVIWCCGWNASLVQSPGFSVLFSRTRNSELLVSRVF